MSRQQGAGSKFRCFDHQWRRLHIERYNFRDCPGFYPRNWNGLPEADCTALVQNWLPTCKSFLHSLVRPDDGPEARMNYFFMDIHDTAYNGPNISGTRKKFDSLADATQNRNITSSDIRKHLGLDPSDDSRALTMEKVSWAQAR